MANQRKNYFIWHKQVPDVVSANSPKQAIAWYFVKERDRGNITEHERHLAANACLDLYNSGKLPVTTRNPAFRKMIGKTTAEIARTVAYDISFGAGKPEKYDEYFEAMKERPIAHLMNHCTRVLFADPQALDRNQQ